MADRLIDPVYLHYQYSNAEKLRLRIETHERYSENRQSFIDWMLGHIAPAPGVALDVGCGSGIYHPAVAAHGMRIVAVDFALGMLREVRQQADERRLPVLPLRANAEQLPVREASCERVLANHMLYHVPDQFAALREMRRVLKPGGRVVLATNAADSMHALAELHREAAESCGYTVPQVATLRFSLDDLPLVQAVFPYARRSVRDDALVFPSAEPALRYYASGPINAIEQRPANDAHHARLLPFVAARIAAIIARDGVFRVPKRGGCFVAEV